MSDPLSASLAATVHAARLARGRSASALAERAGVSVETIYATFGSKRVLLLALVEAARERVARIAVRRGCGRMEWTVLDWNTPSIDFYEALGARLRRDWILTRLTGAPLRRLSRGR